MVTDTSVVLLIFATPSEDSRHSSGLSWTTLRPFSDTGTGPRGALRSSQSFLAMQSPHNPGPVYGTPRGFSSRMRRSGKRESQAKSDLMSPEYYVYQTAHDWGVHVYPYHLVFHQTVQLSGCVEACASESLKERRAPYR